MTTVPPNGFVHIVEEGNEFGTIIQQAGPAYMGGGYGGWAGVGRPRSTSMVEWQGHPPMQLTVPVMFDGISGGPLFGDSIETDILAMEKLSIKDDALGQPPVLRVVSNTVPGTNKKWVLNDLEWLNDDVRRPSDGARVRASATLIFVEFITEKLIATSAQKRTKSKSSQKIKTRKKKGTYIVREGDTLQKIARHELGTSHRWHEIAKLNKIRDGKSIRTGQRIRLP